MVGQVIQDTTVGQLGQFGVQGVFTSFPTKISFAIHIFFSFILLNFTLVITAFIFFQLRAKADGGF